MQIHISHVALLVADIDRARHQRQTIGLLMFILFYVTKRKI